MNHCSVRVFGVQPLALTGAGGALLRPEATPGEDGGGGSESPDWVAELEGLYPNRHFRYRRLGGDLAVAVDGQASVLSAWLCSNVVLNQHVVVFELQAGVLAYPDIDVRAWRGALAATADDRRPAAVVDLLVRAREWVAGSVGCALDDIGVVHDTCNVTLFLEPADAPALPASAETACFLHGAAERLTVRRTEVEVSGATRVFLGGRAHVVISTSHNDVSVIRQIMFAAQVTWFYASVCLRHATSLHRQLHGRHRRQGLVELEAEARDLVYAYQTMRLQNESEKIAWEALKELVYCPIAAAWAIEGSLDQLQRYAEFFQGFIKDVREVQARRADEILNYVLAALALFGLVGLWANVLGAEAAVRALGSWANLVDTATGSALGLTTVVFIVVSALIAAALIAYGIRARHGRR